MTSSWTSYLLKLQGTVFTPSLVSFLIVPDSASPSSPFKFFPCSASYSLFSSSLLWVFWLLPLSVHRSPCTFFFFIMLSSVRHSAWEITPLLLHKQKALKNLRWENLGCLLFQSGLRHSRILCNIVSSPFYTDEDIKGHWGKGHAVITNLHLRASGLTSFSLSGSE